MDAPPMPGEIRIDLAEIRRSIAALDTEREAGPMTSASDFRRQMGWTIQFGRFIPSPRVRATRLLAEQALTETYQVSRAHSAAAQTLAAAGQKILQQYGGADQLATADLQAVGAAFNEAIIEAERAALAAVRKTRTDQVEFG